MAPLIYWEMQRQVLQSYNLLSKLIFVFNIKVLRVKEM